MHFSCHTCQSDITRKTFLFSNFPPGFKPGTSQIRISSHPHTVDNSSHDHPTGLTVQDPITRKSTRIEISRWTQFAPFRISQSNMSPKYLSNQPVTAPETHTVPCRHLSLLFWRGTKIIGKKLPSNCPGRARLLEGYKDVKDLNGSHFKELLHPCLHFDPRCETWDKRFCSGHNPLQLQTYYGVDTL